MKQFLNLLFFFSVNFTFGQNKTEQPVSINVEILGKGYFVPAVNIQGNKPGKYYKNCYKARLEIVNNEDSTLPVTIWTCSWDENWESGNDSIFILATPLCTANYPTEIEIQKKSRFFLL